MPYSKIVGLGHHVPEGIDLKIRDQKNEECNTKKDGEDCHASVLKFVRNLNYANDNFMWISILVDQIKLHHGIISLEKGFDFRYLVSLQMFFEIPL